MVENELKVYEQKSAVISLPLPQAQANKVEGRNGQECYNVPEYAFTTKAAEDKTVDNVGLGMLDDRDKEIADSDASLLTNRGWATQKLKRILKVVYMLHFLPRSFLLVIFSGFDTKCALFEKATVVNCSEEFLVPQPKYWSFAWMITSTCSSFIIIALVWSYRKRIEYSFKNSIKKLLRKASFWRMNFFLSIVFIEYCITLRTSDKLHTILYVLLFARWFSTALVIYCLNYVNPRRISANENKMYYQVGYWLTLLMYFAECTAVLLLYLLNSTLVLTPAVDHKGGNYQALILIVFGFKVALSSQFLTFFLEKTFHGDKDLFSEPGDPVEMSEIP